MNNTCDKLVGALCPGVALDWRPETGTLGDPCKWRAILPHLCHLLLCHSCDGRASGQGSSGNNDKCLFCHHLAGKGQDENLVLT